MTTTPPKPLYAVLAADEGYSLPLVVTVASMLSYLQQPIRVCVCDSGLSPATRATIDRLVDDAGCGETFWIDGASLASAKRETARHQSAATFARLEIPELLPADSRLLYLDSDLLITADVCQMEGPDSQVLAAVADYSMPTFRDAEHLPSLEGMSPEIGYFAAGVLHIDTAEWLEQRIGERCLELLADPRYELAYNDQDALNLVIGGDWRPLDWRWNVHLGAIYSGQRISDWPRAHAAQRDPGILHFTGPRKAWHASRPRAERLRWMRSALGQCVSANGLGVSGAKWLSKQYFGSMWRRVSGGGGTR